MTHDPMCEWWQAQCEGYDCAPDPGEVCEHFYCLCELIAKVRADMLARCIEAVEALGDVSRFETFVAGDGYLSGGYGTIDVVAVLRALQEPS